MDKYEEYKARKTEEVSKLVESTKRKLAKAKRLKENRDYLMSRTDTENRIYIVNVCVENPYCSIGDPRIKGKPTYMGDPVFQKLNGVENNVRARKHWRTNHFFLDLFRETMFSLREKVKNRQMPEQEYNRFLAEPRSETYNRILREVANAMRLASNEIRENPRKSRFSDRFEKKQQVQRRAARKLEEILNINLSRRFPEVKRKITSEELAQMPLVYQRRALLLGKVEENDPHKNYALFGPGV